MDIPTKKALPNRRKPLVLVGGGLLVLGVVLAAAVVLMFAHERKTQPKPPVILTSQATLSSVEPSPKTVANYAVPAANPKYIAIPAIHINNTPIIKLGLLSNGTIAAPNNIYLTGWYDASSKPGQKGAMFIYGNVSSWQANGVFYKLKQLHSGNTIIITRGDNTTYTYKVVSTKTYAHDHVDMRQVFSPIDSNKPGLNLMTCTGKLIKGTSEFDQRLVVFTSLAS